MRARIVTCRTLNVMATGGRGESIETIAGARAIAISHEREHGGAVATSSRWRSEEAEHRKGGVIVRSGRRSPYGCSAGTFNQRTRRCDEQGSNIHGRLWKTYFRGS